MNGVMDNRIYVDVILCQTKEGDSRPLMLIFQDGSAFIVDRIRSKCPMVSRKRGGSGMRYTVVVQGKESCLYEEEDLWYVENPAYAIDKSYSERNIASGNCHSL